MKQSPRTQILREAQPNHDFPIKPKPPPPPSASTRKHQNKSSSKENAPPPLPPPDPSHSPANKIRNNMPLPPRPPSSNPLKRKLSSDSASDTHSFLDSGVKVIVRVRPLSKDEEEGDMIIQKISDDSLMIQDHSFTFDSIADTEATQQDIFELVGAPLVENCLAGFNSSVFAYGQTGSGKTYTMWGPTNALSEGNLCIDQQGLTPRVFQRLFARINEEQLKHADKQLKYQCRCSFLEIYNEQITDLLDPNQRNLQIREDVKSGIYVENLTEEFVFTMKDIMHLLGKGLSNRRIGATSINAESSRSHSVFTCVVESRCKSMADGISSLKTSKINLVDLAGSERQKLTGAGGERLKEAGNINRSLSQLGNLINILAEVSQTGKQRHIPYRDSRLTFLLQESLGGNAKLAMVCAVSPAQSCKSETFSTLRFAQRAKAIKNRAVVNEQMEDDVNHLREIIRQLRDELHRVKANSTNPTGWDTRKSLNILKSLIHPHARLPHLDEDGDEEMEIVEEAVNSAVSEEHKNGNKNASEDIDMDMEEIFEQEEEHDSIISDEPATKTEGSSDANGQDHNMVHGNDGEESIRLDICSSKEISEEQISLCATCNFPTEELPGRVVGADSSDHLSISETRIPTDISIAVEPVSPRTDKVYGSPSELSMVPSEECLVLKSPTPSVSPRISSSRKSLRTSSMLAVSQKTSKGGENSGHGHVGRSSAESLNGNCFNRLAVHNTKSSLPTTDHIAASLHRGIEIIESHQKRSPFRSSSFGFSFKPVESKPILLVEKVDAGVQTVPPEDEMAEKDSVMFLCVNCKTRTQPEVKDDDDSSNLQLVPVDGLDDIENSKTQVPKAVEKVLAGAIRREMALEEFCARQASEIVHLNRLVEQYKHERECNAVIGQTREDKILRLESLMDGVLPSDEFMEEEMASLLHQNKLMKEICENHPDVLRTKIELKKVEDELEHYKNFYDLGEREVLLEEIQDLRNHLQYYVDSSSAKKRITLPKLTDSIEPSLVPPLATILESTEDSAEVKLEKERTRWTEMESKWISLAEELRSELDASRMSAEKLRHELHTEKRCAEELKEAMQMAMEGHARMLEQYADLEEKHIQLLARHRKIQEGIDDVKKAASKAGVKGAESKFINALAAEITALKAEREKERRQFRDEKRGLQAQLRDTAEAVQAAGELLVRLKEAEEAVSIAQKRALNAEQEVAKAYIQIDELKTTHEREINTLNEVLAQSKQVTSTGYIGSETTKYNVLDPIGEGDQQWREEFASFYNGADGALAKSAVPSWFSGYDRCNI